MAGLLWLPVRVEAKGVNLEERTLEGMGSTIQPDMVRDVIDPAAWRKSLARWKKRGSMPKFLAYHMHRLMTGDSPVLGPMHWLKVIPNEGLKFKAEFAETPLGEQHLQLYSTGAMDYFSVGFQILNATMDPDFIKAWLKDRELKFKVPEEVDRLILEAELIEISAVVVGANLSALVTNAAPEKDCHCEGCDGHGCGEKLHSQGIAAKALERLDLVAGLIPNGDGMAVLKDHDAPEPQEKTAVEPPEDQEEIEGVDEVRHPCLVDVTTSESPEEPVKSLVSAEKDCLKGDPLLVEKRVIPFKDHGYVENEAATWNGPREKREADVSQLKQMCTWYDSDNPETKGSYKLPHHQASDLKAVWRGVSGAMGALLGSRGGVDIPDSDRRRVYNHLVKHYAHWDKTAPEFREYTPEEIKGLEEEGLILTPETVQAEEEKTQMALDREKVSAILKRVETLETQVEGLTMALEVVIKKESAPSGEAGGNDPQTAPTPEDAQDTTGMTETEAKTVLDQILGDLEKASTPQ